VLPTIPSIKLPLGGELSAFADFSLGTPSDCTLAFSLMMQLAPMLASITCLIKVLGVIGKLKDALGGLVKPTPDFSGFQAVIDAINKDCMPCITAVLAPFPNFVFTIKGVLNLLISFLTCIIHELEHILEIQAKIDVEAAQDNPVLLEALQCAQANADQAMVNLKQGLAGVKPLLDMVKTLGSIAQIPGLDDLSLDIPDSPDKAEVVTGLKAKIAELNNTIQSLPG
jgi:hypothetical protein